MTHKITFALVAMTAAFATAAWAGGQQYSQSQQPGTAQPQSQMSLQDMRKSMMISKIHHTHQKEIKLSQMAVEKSQSPEVKQLAQTILNDHQQADNRLQQLAKSSNIELQDFKTADYEQASMDQMNKLSGPQFDQAFLDTMHMGHMAVMNDLQMAKKHAKDSQLKAEINNLIPSVKRHMQMSGKQFKQVSRQMESQKQMAGEAPSDQMSVEESSSQ